MISKLVDFMCHVLKLLQTIQRFKMNTIFKVQVSSPETGRII